MTPNETLAAIEEAGKRATPRPWEVLDNDPYDHVFTVEKHPKRVCNVFGGLGWEYGLPTAAYITLAANHADTLAAELRELRAKNEQLRNGIAAYVEEYKRRATSLPLVADTTAYAAFARELAELLNH